ncbi:MAG: nuclear transport factor 2 family protein [Saprospiraceae bacterium]|nr:nuclear transport factor 2 family protein [Saprospiraceae bacterium]
MKFYLIYLFSLLSLWSYGQNIRPNTNEELESSIHAIHLKKFKWLAEQQYDSLSTLLHDDVHYIHSNGWKESKADVIANLKSGKLTYTEVKVHESVLGLLAIQV